MVPDPLFVRVIVAGMPNLVKASDEGEYVSGFEESPNPVPLKLMVCGESGASLVRENKPEREPAAEGVKSACKVQDAPGATMEQSP